MGSSGRSVINYIYCMRRGDQGRREERGDREKGKGKGRGRRYIDSQMMGERWKRRESAYLW